jgi:hypothetical protein
MNSQNPVLVIDRDGLIGKPLSVKLSKEFLVVFVSQESLDQENQNIIHVPFLRKFPSIPDSKYCRIIIVDEELQDLELLPKIIKKVKDINSDFVFVQELSEKGDYAVDKILHLYHSAKIVIIGDTFDNKLILRRKNSLSIINKYIYQAQKFGKIQVLGEGLRRTYPVALGDVVDALSEIVIGVHKSHSLFYIFPKHPPTELSLAHALQKNNPEITVDFLRRDNRLRNITYPPGGVNLLGDEYALTKKIRRVDIGKIVKMRNGKFNKTKSKLKKLLIIIFWALLFLSILPYVSTLAFSFLSFNAFNYAENEIGRGNIDNAKSSLHLSRILYSLGKQASGAFSFQANIFGIQKQSKSLLHDLDFDYGLTDNMLDLINAQTYFSKVFSGQGNHPVDDFEKGKNYLKNSIVNLNNKIAEGKISTPILRKLESVSSLIKLLSNTIDVSHAILGIEEPKTYLILFQDNTQLMSGGGTIESYGVLKFNMGKIIEFSTHDVSDADQKLRGHVEPPFAIRRYLNEKHWNLKNSNFDVDFTKSASASSNFIFAEIGEDVDGAMSIDSEFINNILHIIGPINIKNYKQSINEKNFYALLQSHTQGDNLLGSVGKMVIEKAIGDRAHYSSVAQVISDALSRKQILIWSKNFQNIFTVNGWSSSLWDEGNNKNSVNDFLGLSETDLGLSNANNFVKRQMSQKILLENEGNIQEELIIDYKNENVDVLNGDYKNYLRIILPGNARLTEISINGNVRDMMDAITDPSIYEVKTFKSPKALEVEKTSEENKNIFGFRVTVPAGKTLKVGVKYLIPQNVALLNAFSYHLKLFKQPGINEISYLFSLIYPDSLAVIKSFDNAIIKKGEISYSQKLIKDENLIINFSNK